MAILAFEILLMWIFIEEAPAAKSGWFSGWLRKPKDPNAENKPKAIRAKLGEEIKFVYDEKQKRWVNPNVSSQYIEQFLQVLII